MRDRERVRDIERWTGLRTKRGSFEDVEVQSWSSISCRELS